MAHPSIPPLHLADYRQIVVLTGAGVSVASGLHTYRGLGGLWNELDVEGHATAAAIAAEPTRVWEFFTTLRHQVAKAEPNAAHLALARAEEQLPSNSRMTIITQNVDGLHLAAGSQHVVELHGTLHETCCTSCEYSRRELLDGASMKCPACPECGATLRAAVVLFDEPIPVDAEWEAKKALRDCDLFLAVGTSGTVSPASNFVRSAEYAGARTIYLNTEPMVPPNPAFRETVLGPAEKVLPALLRVDVG